MERKRTSLLVPLAAAALPVCFSIGASCCAELVKSAPSLAASHPASSSRVVAPTVSPTTTATRGDFAFSVRPDRTAVLEGGDGLMRVELTIRSSHPPSAAREPTDLVLMLDTSGSMQGQKIRDARAAAAQLVRQVGDMDRLALVDFNSRASLVIPLVPATDIARNDALRRLDTLRANGTTNMPAGLDVGLGLFQAGSPRATRAILISDGKPNHPGDLEARARSAARSEHPLTTVGIGEDYDEALMSRLADLGTGNFYWVQEQDDLARVFSAELSAAAQTVANRLEVTYRSRGGVELVDASGYDKTVTGDGATFRVGNLYAGQERRFWVTVRVPSDHAGPLDLGQFQLSAGRPDDEDAVMAVSPGTVEVTPNRVAWLASVDPEAWGRSVVEEEYSVLRTEVSRFVQAGQKDAALSAIRSYEDRNRELNVAVQSEAVTSNLAETTALARDVEVQFTGTDQAVQQNRFAKGLNFSAYGSRRAGQAAGYP